MSVLSKKYFHDADAAREHLESVLWPNGPVCPHCKNRDRIYDLSKTRAGLKKCGKCRKQFTVTVKTVFERSHIPLNQWLQVAYLMSSSKKGVSAHQIHRMLGVTYKTAWFMCHRIREAMRDGDPAAMGGPGKILEADETYIGNTNMAKHRHVFVNGHGWVMSGGLHNKHMVVSLVERGGRARSVHVKGLSTSNIREVVLRNTHRDSDLMTDQARAYQSIGKEFMSHEKVNHSHKEWARGHIHTNTIEGFFSIFKRGMKGIYQHCSEAHLQRYLHEFDFRYSNRDVSDERRTEIALTGIVGKRLTYQQPRLATDA